jgi:ElaA protein
MTKMLTYECKAFTELTVYELYALMRLRQEVFIIEQDCNYLDADNKDQLSHHILGIDSKGSLHAYARILPAGIAYDGYASIGRVINAHAVRRQGEGIRLMEYARTCIALLYPGVPVKISAQSYLLNFYGKFGFIPIGDEYLEDNIPHTAMILKV